MASSSSSAIIRSWRTAFLTLRDETLTSSSLPPQSLLHSQLFSHSETLISAAPHLSPHEVTSDVMFLVMSSLDSEATHDTCIHACHLVHGVSCSIRFEINSTSWAIMLKFLKKMVLLFLGQANASASIGNATRMKVIMETLEIVRHLFNGYGRTCSLPESTQLVNLLLHTVTCSHAELFSPSYSSDIPQYNGVDSGARFLKSPNLWEVQTLSFVMIGEALSRIGDSVPVDMWLPVLEVLRKVMDSFASKAQLVENNVMSRFYTSVLQCMHLILSDPKCSLSDHVAGLVASLRMFFGYGLTRRSTAVSPNFCNMEKTFSSLSNKSTPAVTTRVERGPYRPPHLRKREGKSMQSLDADSKGFSDNETTTALGFTSSDSEHSDSDGLGTDADYYRSSKIRITAITCIQNLCQAEPKSLSTNWTTLLPTNDVLQPRKYEATLMTCLLFDPVLKARVVSASTLAAVLGGASTVFLQVAEYRESSKSGSFTALSSSLGQILVQLHAGVLHLVEHEAHSGLMTSLFKVLTLLISATPYARMPGELLPSVISSLRSRMKKGFSSRTDQTGLIAVALSCLGAAFSISPPSLQVKEMLIGEIKTGSVEAQRQQSVLLMLFQFSERVANPTISLEALQVLRVVSHNYPTVMTACWEQVSIVTYKLLKGNGGLVGTLGDKFTTAAVRVLDECLRAISGFRGTEDVLDDRSHDTPFTADSTRTKRISSAPSYEHEPDSSKGSFSEDFLGSKQWDQAIEKHLPMILLHKSPMVRAASVTCFAGITSSVFSSLSKERQDFVLSSSVSLALNDEVPSVRSAACRSIGVIACFPQISQRADILDKFIHAAELNTRDPLVSVRITASWALANLCDSVRHSAMDLNEYSPDLKTNCRSISLLAECALRLTKDGDKIKSNAVRALGSLSRFVRFTSIFTQDNEPLNHAGSSFTTYNMSQSSQTSILMFDSTSVDSHWLGRMVQAFVSCVTTGNVKVRWNVCHALSNLFLNETLRLQDMAWAPSVFSILLLLLRDSSNFKIRIHAAAALAVPASRLDYGSSFPDVVQGLEHVLETLGSDQNSTPSSYRYRDALEKQLTSTTLHVLGLASCTDYQPLKDFLTKKASFLENWLKLLCSSLLETGESLKKEMILKTIKSLVEVYECSSNQGLARRFEKLMDCVS